MRLPVLIASLALAAGCSGPRSSTYTRVEEFTAEEVAAMTLVLEGPEGGTVLLSPGFYLDGTALVALRVDSRQPRTVVLALLTYGRRFETVDDPEAWSRYGPGKGKRRVLVLGERIERAEGEAGPLEVQAIDESGATVGVGLPLEYLEARRSTGFTVRFYGPDGERVATVPGPFVDGFLQRVDLLAESGTGPDAPSASPVEP